MHTCAQAYILFITVITVGNSIELVVELNFHDVMISLYQFNSHFEVLFRLLFVKLTRITSSHFLSKRNFYYMIIF